MNSWVLALTIVARFLIAVGIVPGVLSGKRIMRIYLAKNITARIKIPIK